MKFTGLDRIAILHNALIPDEGDHMLMKLARNLRRDLMFNEEDLDAIQYKKLDNGGFSYDLEKAFALTIDVEISKYIADEVWRRLQELDKTKKLTVVTVTLYDKFEEFMNGA